MGIAISLQNYLDSHAIAYDCLPHRRTGCSIDTADVSQIPSDNLAKAVVLRRREGYILAVVPASSQVKLDDVGGWLKQPVSLATEDEVASLFPDCEPGAIPPVAAAYGLRSLVDDSLENRRDIYFEAGDHRTLVHMTGANFHKLVAKVPHGSFSRPMTRDEGSYYSGA